jgi:hypothetical protein
VLDLTINRSHRGRSCGWPMCKGEYPPRINGIRDEG